MEDQPTGSGDLTSDVDSRSVPQGKAARSRHRLPRQKAGRADADAVAAGADDVVNETDSATPDANGAEDEPAELGGSPEGAEVADVPEVARKAAAQPEAGPDETAIATPTKRRLLPWRRDKAAGVPTVQLEPDADAAVASADDTDAPQLDEGTESSTTTTSPPVGAADGEAAGPDGDVEAREPDLVLVPHRPAGRAFKAAAVAAGALFVAAAAFAGATLQPYLAERAVAHTKFEIARTAANAITTLWTYTPDNMDKLPDRAAKFLGGDFAADYRRYIDGIIEPNKQAKISNDTQVLGVAVDSLTPVEASALVYTNSVATSPVTKGVPSLRYLSYRLTLEARDRQWLITKMTAVTSLDLTPRL